MPTSAQSLDPLEHVRSIKNYSLGETNGVWFDRLRCQEIKKASNLSSGPSGDVFKVETDIGIRLVKIVLGKSSGEQIVSEYEGLEALSKAVKAIKLKEEGQLVLRLPKLFGYEVCENQEKAYMVSEYLSLKSVSFDSMREFGRSLAIFHKYSISDEGRFGWPKDNFIGKTKQVNSWNNSWIEFYKTRIVFMLTSLSLPSSDHINRIANAVLTNIGLFFKDLELPTGGFMIKPVLLHGDLWAGNFYHDESGTPTLIDPACYYGHHEAELSIMSMFGSMPKDFYQGYFEVLPRKPFFGIRQQLYQLYHYLNHLLMFGDSYYHSTKAILIKLFTFVKEP